MTVERKQMLFIMILFLTIAVSVVESEATGRALSSDNFTTSVESNPTSQETVIQWVQITAVPLGVFLLGACIWGIIQNTAASLGNSLNEFGGCPSEAANQVPTDRLSINRRNAADLEQGYCEVELAPRRRMGDLASALNSPQQRSN